MHWPRTLDLDTSIPIFALFPWGVADAQDAGFRQHTWHHAMAITSIWTGKTKACVFPEAGNRRLVTSPAQGSIMEAFAFSTLFVALAEMGDKTQLLALLLAARFKKPWPIVWGILVATLANHALAGALGALLAQWLGPEAMRWILGVSFVAMAFWLLIPDKADDESPALGHWGVFGATTIAFFLAEMGDKTQIATVGLAARFDSLVWVVAGTTLGMMLANAPAVWLGERMTRAIPVSITQKIAAGLFALLGIAVLLGLPLGL